MFSFSCCPQWKGWSEISCKPLAEMSQNAIILFFLFFLNLFIFGCVGPSFLREGPPQLQQAGATPHRGARAPHHRGLPCCGAQAPDAQAQQPRPTGPDAPRHAGSFQTRARTRAPRTGRRTPNHCTTREAPQNAIFNDALVRYYLTQRSNKNVYFLCRKCNVLC